MYVCTYTCVYKCVTLRGQLGAIPQDTFHLHFWDRIFHGLWISFLFLKVRFSFFSLSLSLFSLPPKMCLCIYAYTWEYPNSLWEQLVGAGSLLPAHKSWISNKSSDLAASTFYWLSHLIGPGICQVHTGWLAMKPKGSLLISASPVITKVHCHFWPIIWIWGSNSGSHACTAAILLAVHVFTKAYFISGDFPFETKAPPCSPGWPWTWSSQLSLSAGIAGIAGTRRLTWLSLLFSKSQKEM